MPTLDEIFGGAGNIISNVSNTAKDALSDVLGMPGNSSSQLWPVQTNLLPEYACLITCSDLNIHFKAPLPPSFTWSMDAIYDSPIKEVLNGAVSGLGSIGQFGKTAAQAQGISMVTQALTSKFWTGSSTGGISIPIVLQAESDEISQVMQPLLWLYSLTMPKLAGGVQGSVLEAPGPHFDIAKAFNAAKDATASLAGNNVSVAGSTSASNTSSSGFGAVFGSFKSAVEGIGTDLLSGNLAGAANTISGGIQTAASSLDALAQQGIRNQITLQIGTYIRIPSVVITNISQTHYMEPIGAAFGQSSGTIQRVELDITFEPFMDLTQDDLPKIFIDPRVAKLAQSMLDARNGTPESQRKGL